MSGTDTPELESPRPQDADLIRAFRRDGHALIRQLASGEEVAAYRPAIRDAALGRTSGVPALEDRDTYGRAFLQATNLWQQDPAVERFVLSRRFASVAAQLLGVDRVRLYHDQALFKEPGGGMTPWHQDCLYWPLDTDLTVTMWMPLVDVLPEMGGLGFASGSHVGRQLGDYGISDESEEYFERRISEQGFSITNPVPMSAGDATFHAGWTVHRALPNTGTTMREVMTIIWLADGLTVAEPKTAAQRADMTRWFPGLQPGDPIDSELNPRLP